MGERSMTNTNPQDIQDELDIAKTYMYNETDYHNSAGFDNSKCGFNEVRFDRRKSFLI
jgi:hypothetical protein